GLWSASWSLAHTTNLLDLGIGASYTRFTSRAIALSDTSGLNRTLGAGIGFHIALATLIAAGALLVGPRALGVVVPGGALASQAGRAEWSELLSFGLRIQVVRAAEILGAHVPRLTLAFGPGLAVAGIYDLGARIAGVLQVSALPLPVIQPLAGRLAARHEESKLRALVERATRYVAILAIPGVTLVLLDAEAILRAWTGRQVPSAAAGAARLLAVA